MFKFKKGDLVEILKSKRGNVGYRFLISDYKVGILEGTPDVRIYKSDIETPLSVSGYLWTAEHNLKLIKPDTPSDISFEELMLDLKQPQAEGVR